MVNRGADRVRLSPLSAEDGPDLAQCNLANRDYHAPWSAPFTDQTGFDAFRDAMQLATACAFVARRIEDNAPVAVIAISQIARGNFQSAYMGFYGYRETGGQGLVRSAVGLALDACFGTLALHRVEANVQPGNMRSLALVRALGFRHEGFSPAYLKIAGEWRDHERFAMLAEDWSRAGRTTTSG